MVVTNIQSVHHAESVLLDLCVSLWCIGFWPLLILDNRLINTYNITPVLWCHGNRRNPPWDRETRQRQGQAAFSWMSGLRLRYVNHNFSLNVWTITYRDLIYKKILKVLNDVIILFLDNNTCSISEPNKTFGKLNPPARPCAGKINPCSCEASSTKWRYKVLKTKLRWWILVISTNH